MEIISILIDIILNLARLIVDLLYFGACIYVLYKIIRGYDVTIELKTNKPKTQKLNRETTTHNR